VNFFLEYFSVFKEVLLSFYTFTASVIVYNMVGGIVGEQMSSYCNLYGSPQVIAAGAELADSGWVSLDAAGEHPAITVTITAHAIGQREVEMAVDYAQLNADQLEVFGRQRRSTLANVDYYPKVLNWKLFLDRSIGMYCRVRECKNNGDMDITVDFNVPSFARPVPSGYTTLDREVEEEVL